MLWAALVNRPCCVTASETALMSAFSSTAVYKFYATVNELLNNYHMLTEIGWYAAYADYSFIFHTSVDYIILVVFSTYNNSDKHNSLMLAFMYSSLLFLCVCLCMFVCLFFLLFVVDFIRRMKMSIVIITITSLLTVFVYLHSLLWRAPKACILKLAVQGHPRSLNSLILVWVESACATSY